jgi:glycosyltransferase involved in cell wall biosynthesis
MSLNFQKIRIVFFIGNLSVGGKERRLLELLTYLKKKDDYEILVLFTRHEIHFPEFYNLNIPYKIINKGRKKIDLSRFFEFYKICKQYNPDIIHTWGQMQTFYALPTVIGQQIPLVNSQITSAPARHKRSLTFKLINWLNFHFSKVVLANSKAGLESFNPPKRKRKVIYNGINLNRFKNLPDIDKVKDKYGITTPHTVIMVAAYSATKDYSLFLRVAKMVTKLRKDVTFLGIGESQFAESEYSKLVELSAQDERIHFKGKINDVEALVNVCTIGVLFSVDGEGFSNAIMEYMALGKPVIANNAGGTKELVRHNETGYLFTKQSEEEIVSLIIELIDDPQKARGFGIKGQQIIQEEFSIHKMGHAFEQVYQEALVKWEAAML